jgi:peptidoglycan hydrolase CwlO-like protein
MKRTRQFLFFVVIILFSTILFHEGTLYAQVGQDDVLRRRAELEADLTIIEKEIEEQQALLDSKKSERVSLERDVSILDAQIKKAQLGIRARDLAISQLSNDIGQKRTIIGDLDDQLEREKEALAELLRKTNEVNSLSLVEMVLATDSVSSFFEDIDSFDTVKRALQNSFVEIESTKTDTEDAKKALEQKKEDETELRGLQVLQRQQIERQEKEKQDILRITKGVETAYQTLVRETEKSAAQIRAELFSLRDSAAIPFGEAVELAEFASRQTGVRPAFILGVLKQETRLGEYLGTGVWSVDMHPTRDKPLFQVITATLGLDPNKMPVSKQPSYGWGGAMGPAQFIPSTWACYGGYINTNTDDCANSKRSLTWDNFWAGPWVYEKGKDRLRKLLEENRPSNPWQNRDAFMASALLLADNGGDKGGYDSERLAALRYFAGWTNAKKPAYAFYGDSVMEHAAVFQKQIDILAGG